MWRTGHYMNFYSTRGCMYQPFNNNKILETFVLYKQGMLRFIDKPCYPCPAIVAAPDQVHIFIRFKVMAVPIGFKTLNNFFYFMQVSSDDGIITCFGQVFCFPVQ